MKFEGQNIGFRWGWAALLIFIHFLLGFTASLHKSPTADEYTYIATGALYVQTGDFRLDRTHPPLLRLLIGLPLQLIPLHFPPLQKEIWDTPASYFYGYRLGWTLLLGGQNRWETILLLARLPILLLSCGLAFLIYLWAKDLYGEIGAGISLVFYCFCPNMLAHAGLATLDLGISFFYCLTLFLFYRYGKSLRIRDLALTGVSLGCALAVKVTALLLLPILLIAMFWIAVPREGFLHKSHIKSYLQKITLLLAIALFTLLLSYGFPFQKCYYLDTLNNVFSKSLSTGGGGEEIPGMPHRNYAFYLLGQYSSSGWFYYFLVAVLVKTPLVIWIALLLVLCRGQKKWQGLPDFFIVGGIVILHIAALFDRVNIGLRHILPFYPLLYLYLGRIDSLWQRKKLKWLILILGLWFVGANLWIYPDYLAYFNEAAGGPENGHKILDDSNLDWGQDLSRLQTLQKQYPQEPFYVATNWMFIPHAFHVDAKLLQEEQIAAPPKGIVVVGKHWAIRHRLHSRSPNYFDWLEKYKPVGNLGHSMWVFKF